MPQSNEVKDASSQSLGRQYLYWIENCVKRWSCRRC